jgi:hypothetical protein
MSQDAWGTILGSGEGMGSESVTTKSTSAARTSDAQ